MNARTMITALLVGIFTLHVGAQSELMKNLFRNSKDGQIQSLGSVLASKFDYERYDFDWTFGHRDTLTYSNIYALPENGGINHYTHIFNYESDNPQYFVLSFGIDTLINLPFEYMLVFPVHFYSDSVYFHVYIDSLEQLYPEFIGYMTRHSDTLLSSFHIYLNSTLADSPPFVLTPFVFLDYSYNAAGGISTLVAKAWDFLVDGLQTDSMVNVWSSMDQLLTEHVYTNNNLRSVLTNYYDGSETKPYAIVDRSCVFGPCQVRDSTYIEYFGTQDSKSYHYRGNPLFLNSITEFMMFDDTASLETTYAPQFMGPDEVVSDTRTSYDDLMRPLSILDRTRDFYNDTLAPSRLSLFLYPGNISIVEETAAFADFEHRINGNHLLIEFTESFTGGIQLVATGGQLLQHLMSTNLTQINISLNGLHAGVYYVTLWRKQDQANFRFFYPGE